MGVDEGNQQLNYFLYGTYLQVVYGTYLQVVYGTYVQVVYGTYVQVVYGTYVQVVYGKYTCIDRQIRENGEVRIIWLPTNDKHAS